MKDFFVAISSGQLLFLAHLAYVTGFVLAYANRAKTMILWIVTVWVMAIAIVLNGLALSLRYWHSWPMMPMYFGLPALLCCLAVIWLTGSSHHLSDSDRTEGLLVQGLIVSLGFVTLLFPKDFYLPFLRSATIWSHIFLITGIVAKACLLMASVKALVFLIGHWKNKTGTRLKILPSTMPWALWGFVCLTVSMFTGEIWSYLGWGTPVVWHDPAITTVMAIWFYWIAFLHLHYTRTWNSIQRAIFMVVGGLLLLVFACHPDMGPFRFPFT